MSENNPNGIVVEMPQIGGTISIDLGVGPQGNRGIQGPPGPQGVPGPKGETGFGIPPGGTTNQWIHKKSDTDFDVEWADLPNTMEIHICTVNEYDAQTGIPTIQNPNVKTFYLVPGGEGNDLYAEWIYINNGWEKFGVTTLDLSGLVSDVQVNGTSVTSNGIANVPIKEDYVVNARISFRSRDDYRPSTVVNDKTAKEVYEAYLAGKNVYASLTGWDGGYPGIERIPLVRAWVINAYTNHSVSTSYNLNFGNLRDTGGSKTYYSLRVSTTSGSDDGTWIYSETPASAFVVNFSVVEGVIRADKEFKDIYYAYADGGYVVGHMVIEEKDQQFQLRSVKMIDGGEYANQYEFVFDNDRWALSASGTSASAWQRAWYLTTKTYGQVMDVRVNSNSILENGIANIPVAGWGGYESSTLGVVKGGNGVSVGSGGTLMTVAATASDIKQGSSQYFVVTPSNMHQAAFYGLAKASGDSTQGNSSNAVGTYTDTAKQKIRQMLGIGEILDIDCVATYNIDPSTGPEEMIATGQLFMMNGKLYKALEPIVAHGTAVPFANCVSVAMDAEFERATFRFTGEIYSNTFISDTRVSDVFDAYDIGRDIRCELEVDGKFYELYLSGMAYAPDSGDNNVRELYFDSIVTNQNFGMRYGLRATEGETYIRWTSTSL